MSVFTIISLVNAYFEIKEIFNNSDNKINELMHFIFKEDLDTEINKTDYDKLKDTLKNLKTLINSDKLNNEEYVKIYNDILKYIGVKNIKKILVYKLIKIFILNKAQITTKILIDIRNTTTADIEKIYNDYYSKLSNEDKKQLLSPVCKMIKKIFTNEDLNKLNKINDTDNIISEYLKKEYKTPLRIDEKKAKEDLIKQKLNPSYGDKLNNYADNKELSSSELDALKKMFNIKADNKEDNLNKTIEHSKLSDDELKEQQEAINNNEVDFIDGEDILKRDYIKPSFINPPPAKDNGITKDIQLNKLENNSGLPHYEPEYTKGLNINNNDDEEPLIEAPDNNNAVNEFDGEAVMSNMMNDNERMMDDEELDLEMAKKKT